MTTAWCVSRLTGGKEHTGRLTGFRDNTILPDQDGMEHSDGPTTEIELRRSQLPVPVLALSHVMGVAHRGQ